MNQQAAQNYLKTKVFTATPEQLQLMLYDGAIRFAEQGKIGLEQKNFEVSYSALSRAQKIMSELTSSLKHSVAPEMCKKLAGLYAYIYRRLLQGNIEHKIEAVEEAIQLLQYQRETWVMLLGQLGKSKAAVAASKLDLPSPDSRMEASISMQG